MPRFARALLALLFTFTLMQTALFAMTPISTGDGSWYWQHPLPCGNPLYSACWSDANTLWVTGYLGVFKTTDAGLNWTRLELGIRYGNNIIFVSPTKGWFTGVNTNGLSCILKTTDGGRNWVTCYTLPQGYTVNTTTRMLVNGSLIKLHVNDTNNGDAPKILSSTDDGVSWSMSNTLPANGPITFLDANNAWLINSHSSPLGIETRIYRTTNGGQTWTSIFYEWSSIGSLCFVDANNGWALDANTVRHTTDGGITWASQTTFSAANLRDIYFINATTGWVFNKTGSIWRTTDGGITWTKYNYGFNLDTFNGPDAYMEFNDVSRGCIVGPGGTVLVTADGGVTWASANSGKPYSITAMKFFNSSTGLAIASLYRPSGYTMWYILRTTDSGRTWIPDQHSLPDGISSLCFINNKIGWAAGGNVHSNATVIKTTDGGITWSQPVTTTVSALHSICFVDENYGWVVGSSRSINRTTDGGATWVPQDSGQTLSQDFFHVFFTDRNTGWITSSKGILKTTDGGATWTLAKQISYAHALYFRNANLGWFTSGGWVYKTTDGGVTWKSQRIIGSSINRLLFTDDNNGWAIGSSGSIAKTTDGGETWAVQQSGTYNDLYCVSAIDPDNVWVGGAYAILHTSSGGNPPVTCVSAKRIPTGMPVYLNSLVVTAKFDGFIYAEQQDRCMGIRINTDDDVNIGDRINVVGTSSKESGERVVDADSVTVIAASSGAVKPLVLSTSALGGSALISDDYQAGVAGAFGPNNIGLLITACGEFVKTSDTTFTIYDGSKTVKCVVPAGVTLNPEWKYVSVTGISSCEQDGANGLLPLIRVRCQGDIVP